MKSTTLSDGEKQLGLFRQHWFVMVKPVVVVAFLLVATVIVFAVEELRGAGTYFLLAVVFSVIVCVYKYFAWHNNIWVVTNKRVVDEWGVLTTNCKESPIDKINNVTFTKSIFGRIFGYGSVKIQTAAEMGDTIEVYVEEPDKLKSAITTSQEGHRQAQIAEQAQALAQSVSSSGGSPGDTKECPYCAETIKAKARICRYCKHEL